MVVQLNYRDNKFVTPDMQEKIDLLRAQDPDEYQHVYEGVCKSTVQDAVYKAQIVEAEKRGRFCRVEYDPRQPVDTFWDLGYGDMVSVWFAQLFPLGQTRLIDFYENTHQAIDHYLQVMQGKGYMYGECVFPWDGGARHVSTGKSTADLVRGKGYRVRVIRQGLVYDQINYLRTIFPQLQFDAEKCAKGIEHLRNYQWGPPGPEASVRREPLHDEHSHAARALDCMATAIKSPAASAPPRAIPERRQFGSLGSFR